MSQSCAIVLSLDAGHILNDVPDHLLLPGRSQDG